MILPYDINTNRVARDMQTAISLIEAVVSGRKPLQSICSPSGFAKTAISLRICKTHDITKWKPGVKPPKNGYFIESRPTRGISAVRVLWNCVTVKAAILLLDDPGPIAKNEEVLDVLKTSFGMQRSCSLETPEITRNERFRLAGSARYDPTIPPPQFPTSGLRLLWHANTNYTDPTVLAKLGDHFAPLIARGLNPWWIGDDREHDNHDLFLYVHYQATEKNLLRNLGFPYRVSQQAVNFYVTHCHRLLDLAPRRLELIARAFTIDIPAAREAELTSMLAKNDLRPRLKLPESWVTVPGGALLWPAEPFKAGKQSDPPPERMPAPEYMGDLEVREPRSMQGISGLELTSESDRAQRPGQTQTFACQSATSPEPGSQTSIEGESLESQLARQKALTAALHRQVMELTAPAKSRRKPRNRRGADA